MKQNPHKVAIVFDTEFGNKLVELSKRMHVWVCDSPTNLKVVKEIWSNKKSTLESGITNFKLSETDSPEDMFSGHIDTIDLHHGEFSHDPPWSVLQVYGIKLSPAIQAELRRFGQGEFKETEDGFIFYRRFEKQSTGHLKIKDIKNELESFKDLSVEETMQFRNKWKGAFTQKDPKIPMHNCANCKGFVNGDAWGYDWHGISYAGVDNCENYLDVILKQTTADEAGIVIFEENCIAGGIIVKFSDVKKFLKNNTNQSFEDIYFTSEDFSWTLVLTHEDGYVGPFFVKKSIRS